jgi:hypothetical protein
MFQQSRFRASGMSGHMMSQALVHAAAPGHESASTTSMIHAGGDSGNGPFWVRPNAFYTWQGITVLPCHDR